MLLIFLFQKYIFKQIPTKQTEEIKTTSHPSSPTNISTESTTETKTESYPILSTIISTQFTTKRETKSPTSEGDRLFKNIRQYAVFL